MKKKGDAKDERAVSCKRYMGQRAFNMKTQNKNLYKAFCVYFFRCETRRV